MKMFVVAMGALFAVSACGKKEGEAAGGASGDLPASCAKAISLTKACLEKAPEEIRKAAGDQIGQQEKAWAEAAKAGGAAKDALEQSCKTLLDSSKQSMAAVCPDVKWE